jgi:hypothetical protein
MRSNEVGGGDSAGGGEAPSPQRFVGKGRYTNAPPMTAAPARPGELTVQVGDVTLVVRDDPSSGVEDKYVARSGPAHGATVVADETGGEGEERVPIPDLLVDDPIPDWGEWRSDVISGPDGYHRSEDRRPG